MFDFRPVTAPYPGLRPFEAHESEIFFGREGHTDRLLEILQRERFLAVIGPSGCGKSSLVRAGLLPGLATGALGTGSRWRLALLRPGGQPLLALAQSLLGRHALGHELLGEADPSIAVGEITADAAILAAELRQGPQGLERLLEGAAASRAAAPLNLLILADQFEEVFTYREAAADPNEAAAFVELLLAARAAPNFAVTVYVALTMRSDFLGPCVNFHDLPEAINRAHYLTPRLKPEEMQRAIRGPATVFGGEVDAGFAGEIIARVGADSDQLPLLQHALARWWRVAETIDPKSPRISQSCTTEVGQVEQALDRHGEFLFNSQPLGRQAAIEALFRAITQGREASAAVRRPQRLADIVAWTGIEQSELQAVIHELAMPEVSFVHHGPALNEDSVIDLTHEALMRQWDRLKRWVEEEYRRGQGYWRWSARAAEHAAGQEGLLTGADLARALEWWNPGLNDQHWQPTARWAARYSLAKDKALAEEFERTRNFLQESRDSEKRQREEAKRRLEEQAELERQRAEYQKGLAERARRMSLIAAAVAILAVLAGAYGWWQTQRAQKAERSRTASLFDSLLNQASLLASNEDYAGARRALTDSSRLDASIQSARLHARNLLAGYVLTMGGQADRIYDVPAVSMTAGVAVSPDGKLLAAGGERATLVLLDADSGKLVRRLQGHDPKALSDGSLHGIRFDPTGQTEYSAGDDGQIIAWSPTTGDKLGNWKVGGGVGTLAISPDGKVLASAGVSRAISITLRTMPGGAILETLPDNDTAVGPIALGFSPGGDRLASADDNFVHIWDVKSGKVVQELKGHTDEVNGVAFSRDGKLVATSSRDRNIGIWNAQTGELNRMLTGHRNTVIDVEFSEDGRDLLSASHDGTLRLWDVASGVTRRVYQGHESYVWSFARHGNVVYSAGDDGTVRRWSLATPEQWVWDTGEPAVAAAISPDGSSVVVGLEHGALRFYAMPDGKLQGEIRDAHTNKINRIAFSPDGHLIATCSFDDTTKLWQLGKTPDGKVTAHLLHTIKAQGGAFYSVVFSPDGRRIATAGLDGRVGVFDVATGQGRRVAADEGQTTSVAFDPAGTHVVSTGSDSRLRLWDADKLDHRPREIGATRDVAMWVAVAPDGRQVAAVGRSSVVMLFDSSRPNAARKLVGHENSIYRAIYSPDGRQLATVSSDSTVRFWDLERARQLFVLQLPTFHPASSNSPLYDFDFRCTSAGECWIAVPLMMGRVAVYRLPYENPPADLAGQK